MQASLKKLPCVEHVAGVCSVCEPVWCRGGGGDYYDDGCDDTSSGRSKCGGGGPQSDGSMSVATRPI